MTAQLSVLIAVFGLLVAASSPTSAQVPGASAACKARCEQFCQSTRLSKGECMLRCTGRCADSGKKKK